MKTQRIPLSSHFNYAKLLRFVVPSVVMMVFTSIYSVVDGLFISNFVGSLPFASINLVYPLIMALGTVGFMIGTGGSAVVAKTLGEGDPKRANETFSMLVFVLIGTAFVLSAAGEIWLRQIIRLMGANQALIEDCIVYGRIQLAGLPAFMLQSSFQSFFAVAEKPKLGLAVTVAAGLTNVLFDFLFVCVFPFGVAGAAVATVMGYIVGGILPLLYFFFPNQSLLRLGKTKLNLPVLLKSCGNGSSEMMSNLSMALVNMLYNVQLMEMVGETGVAAYGVIMYVNFFFVAIFIGYSIGCAPAISYHYGAENGAEVKNLFRKSVVLVLITSVAMTVLGIVLAKPIALLYVGYDRELVNMTSWAFTLFSISFLFNGLNIFGSAFFTALNNGLISATISFLRTLVLQVVMIFLLPMIWGLNGVWLAVVAAELLTVFVTIAFFLTNGKRYHFR